VICADDRSANLIRDFFITQTPKTTVNSEIEAKTEAETSTVQAPESIGDRDSRSGVALMSETKTNAREVSASDTIKIWPFGLMHDFQKNVRKQQLEARHRTEMCSIDKRMKVIRPLPKDFIHWVNEVPLDFSRYIYYKRANNRLIEGYCTSCKKDVEFHITQKTPQNNVRHNQKGECPNCRKAIEFRAEGKTSHRVDNSCAVYTQKTKKGFVLRLFEITKRYSNDPTNPAHYRHPELRLYESARHFYEFEGDASCVGNNGNNNDASGVPGVEVDGYYKWSEYAVHYEFGDFKRTGVRRWCKSVRDDFYYNAPIYTRDLRNAMKGTPWQHSAIYELVTKLRSDASSGNKKSDGGSDYNNQVNQNHQSGFLNIRDSKKEQNIPIQRYLNLYIQYPAYEYLVKSGLHRLVYENIDVASFSHLKEVELNFEGRTVPEILEINKEGLRQLLRLGGDNRHLHFIRLAHKMNKPMTDEQLQTFLGMGIYDSLLEDLLKATLEVTSPQKVINYIRRCKEKWSNERYSDKIKTIATYWRDYLDNCKILGYDMNNDFNIFPRNLKVRHDEVVIAVKVEEDANHIRAIAQLHPIMRSIFDFAHEDLGLVAITPSNIADIVAEGQVLRHCVHTGSYVERIVEGKGYIVFVRRSDAPHIPFYTAEVVNGVITQCRGEENCEMTDEVKLFRDYWQENLVKTNARSFSGMGSISTAGDSDDDVSAKVISIVTNNSDDRIAA